MEKVIEVASVATRFGSVVVHDGVSFTCHRGELLALIGASGTGKTVLLREIIGLVRPTSGNVRLLGVDVWNALGDELNELRRSFGVLFQDGALFSSLSVEENVATPLREHTDLPDGLIASLVQSKLALAGLDPDVMDKMPSQLSGGMRKRVSLARALALDPQVLFLDEPTSGLDPVTARGFDKVIKILKDNLGLTIFMVTHDLDTLLSIVDRVVVLDDGKVLANGSVDEVERVPHPWIQSYFSARSPRTASEDRNLGV